MKLLKLSLITSVWIIKPFMMIYLQDAYKITPFQMNFVVIGRAIKGCVRGWGARLFTS